MATHTKPDGYWVMRDAFEKYATTRYVPVPGKAEVRSAGRRPVHYALTKIFGTLQLAPRAALFPLRRARSQGVRDTLFAGARMLRNFNYLDFHRVVSALTLPNVRIAARRHPRNYFKYFGKYLALSFSTGSRAAILANHYRYLNSRVSSCFMHRLLDEQILLWEEARGGGHFDIRLCYPHGTDSEGDLSLIFYVDSAPVFFMNFTIMPGEMLAVAADQILFVGRIQGVRGSFDAIRHATKTLGELSPPALLFAAAQAISNVLGITTIIGVSNMAQVCIGGELSESMTNAGYDEFWMSIGARKLDGQLHILTAESGEKPLAAIKSNHRSRVKRKRLFKSDLIKQVEQNFRTSCLD